MVSDLSCGTGQARDNGKTLRRQLLSARTSPFGMALIQYQCIKYALDKPGILTVLPGAQSVEEIDFLLKDYDQSEVDLDYSIIGSFAPLEASGKCVYCNHCKSCPAGLDIGMINKFYNLAKIGDDMAIFCFGGRNGHCFRRSWSGRI